MKKIWAAVGFVVFYVLLLSMAREVFGFETSVLVMGTMIMLGQQEAAGRA
jgi:inner membrane protein involved in colicin E2 resistance